MIWSLTRSVRLRAQTMSELARYLADTGQWWLLPMVVVLLFTTLVLVGVQTFEYVAPFVYSIF